MALLHGIMLFIRAFTGDRAGLAAENLALRQQLSVLEERTKRPRLRKRDRISWVWLSRLWIGWRSALLIVQPDTVVAWHRLGWKLYWRRKSRKGKVGRPRIDAEIRNPIRQMSCENPLRGTLRIQSGVALLGHVVADSTIDKYRTCPKKPPSQT